MPKLQHFSILQRAAIALLVSAACFGQVNVVYTGRTLGYFRFPETQIANNEPCSKDAEKKMMGQTAEFNAALQAQRQLKHEEGTPPPEPLLTLGMGDNFGPELGARTFDGYPAQAAGNQRIARPGKDLFVWDHREGKRVWISDSEVDDDLRKKIENHEGQIPNDNVGCFLRVAGYDAITVGKHDFESGPEHLIVMAKFLMSEIPGVQKTAMLGANLAISTAMPDAKPRLPLYVIEHNLEGIEAIRKSQKTPLRSFKVMFPQQQNIPTPTPKLPAVVFPWLRAVDIENAFYLCASEIPNCPQVFPGDLQGKWNLSSSSSGPEVQRVSSIVDAARLATQAYLRQEPGPNAKEPIPVRLNSRIGTVLLCEKLISDSDKTRGPYDFLKAKDPACTEMTDHAPEDQANPDQPGVDPQSHTSGKITFYLPKEKSLRPDQNYAICLQIAVKGAMGPFYCQPFYVSTPFFSSSTGVRIEATDWDADPFLVKNTGDGKVAVFGLLDPDLQNQIGRLNYGWWNQNPDYETTLQVADPKDSLKQAMMRCKMRPECKSAKKVLLAQMPSVKAAQLLSSLDEPAFDLVIAQTDSATKTGEVTLKRRGVGKDKTGNFVVTPDDLYSAGNLTYIVQKAVVSKDTGKEAWDWKLKNKVVKPENPTPASRPGPGHPSLREVAEAALLGLNVKGPFVTWSNAEVLQRLALLAIQRNQAADLSMMQTRDFFEPQTFGPARATPGNLQELLDQVFWKNDFAVRVQMTGAALTTILSASTDFDTLDKNPLNTDPERGRSLVTLGAFKEAGETNLTVNAGIVDPTRAYGVTLTDFLAVGDTGYPQLKTPAVPMPYRMKDFPELRSISGIVCRAIADNAPAMSGALCSIGKPPSNEKLLSSDYLDTSHQLPPDTGSGYTVWQQTRTYVGHPLREDRFRIFYDGQNAAEQLSAQKPFWSISMEKGDLGLNVNLHKAFTNQAQTKGLTNQFSGVPIAAVTAPNSYTVSFDDRTRLKRSSRLFDFYALDDIAFAYTRTQDAADNNFARNLSANSLSFESGILRHVPWRLPGSPKILPELANLLRLPRQVDVLVAGRMDSQVLSPREDITIAAQTCVDPVNCLPNPATLCPPGTTSTPSNSCTALNSSGTMRGTVRRSVDLYGKLGLRFSDTRSWFEFGLMEGRSVRIPYALQLQNGPAAPGSLLYLEPGSLLTNCKAGMASPTNPCAPPTTQTVQDWVAYFSYFGLITPGTKFTGIYQTHPLDGVFLNFSLNTPLPLGRPGDKWADWAAGKGIAFLAENTGKLLFNRSNDLAAQTQYYDKLALSLVIPVVGNFSLKPETDFIYYRNKVANLPFHSVDYLVTFSYTFDWRQGQRFGRAMRFATPPPSATVPTSGK